MESVPETGLVRLFANWWRDERSSHGLISASKKLATAIRQFLCDSLPQNKRQRYGDIDYDWDFRVNTTGAAVDWRTRLLGTLHSPYQPTEPALFHEMLTNLKIDFSKFTFVDVGSGKGRVLLMAADYPFRRIIGIELLPELHQIARENLSRYRNPSQKCFSFEAVCGDAADCEFPPGPLVIYLFNPLPEAGLRKLFTNLSQSLAQMPRQVEVIYHNPLWENIITGSPLFRKIAQANEFCIYSNFRGHGQKMGL